MSNIQIENNIKLLKMTIQVINSICHERRQQGYDQTLTADLAVYQMTIKLLLARLQLEESKIRTHTYHPGSPLHSTVKSINKSPHPGDIRNVMESMLSCSKERNLETPSQDAKR